MLWVLCMVLLLDLLLAVLLFIMSYVVKGDFVSVSVPFTQGAIALACGRAHAVLGQWPHPCPAPLAMQ